MIELIQNFGLWLPAIIAISGGVIGSISFSRSQNGNGEKTKFKIITSKKGERKELKEEKKLLKKSQVRAA